MIFYFSATGNSRHIAKMIAEKTGDRYAGITECLKKELYNFIADKSENIGFVFPVYNFGLPVTLCRFIDKLNIKTNGNYIFTVATYGGFSGGASKIIKKMLAEKNIAVKAQYSVRMPDTWTPIYDLSDKNKVSERNKEADKAADKIIKRINKKKNGNFDYRRIPFSDYFYKDYENLRHTSSLSVEDSCIGCGMCAKNCPENAIEIRKGKPAWIKEKCAMCLGCLHRCPQFAIQRGKNTKKHGQYSHP